LNSFFGKDAWKEFVLLLNGENNIDISSTMVRKKLIDNVSGWEDLCDPKIVEYIKKNIKFPI
jgi:hypothetical protein